VKNKTAGRGGPDGAGRKAVAELPHSKNKKAVLIAQDGLFYFNPGDDLRSHTVTRAVSSARRGLTSVFGMGTGVTLAV
jgi:hypothetical protein